jgi:3-deoxy-D-manno-octulosonic-acid transferase
MARGVHGAAGLKTAARLAYAGLLGVLAPAYLLKLWWRGRSEPLYRHAVGERFGRYSEAPSAGWIWVHAVSLGETRAAAALDDALRERRPASRLLLTHGTATGRAAGAALLREGDRQAWLPYDATPVVARFLDHFRPAIGILMETEVWPGLLAAAHARGVPMVLANARLSERSERRGRRLAPLLAPAVAALDLVLAQSEDDARRLRVAGATRVVVRGNLKFDMTPDAALVARGRAWRAALGRPVVLAAVTREGEEEALLAAWSAAVSRDGLTTMRPLLVIVPRHPQRFDDVAARVQATGLVLARRSAWTDEPPAPACAADVWLGDSMGEMALYYGSADVALLGGSFAPLGGQNLIEAAACGCPVVMGPHTFNFAQAAQLALAAGAAVRVIDLAAAVEEALALLEGPRRVAMAAAALAFAAAHRGAAGRMADDIAGLLTQADPSGAIAGGKREGG